MSGLNALAIIRFVVAAVSLVWLGALVINFLVDVGEDQFQAELHTPGAPLSDDEIDARTVAHMRRMSRTRLLGRIVVLVTLFLIALAFGRFELIVFATFFVVQLATLRGDLAGFAHRDKLLALVRGMRLQQPR